MFHQFNGAKNAEAQKPTNHTSLTDIVQESRHHYLRYLKTIEESVQCQIEILRLQKEDSQLGMFLVPTPEYKLLQYKKEVAEYALNQYRPVIASMAAIATQYSEASFVRDVPSAPISQIEDNISLQTIPLSPTPPSSAVTLVRDNAVKVRNRSNSL